VRYLVVEEKLPVNRACHAIGLSRSAWYRPLEDKLARDLEVIEALQELAETRRRWGFWMCYQRLRNLGHPWNHKRVYRIYKELGLNHRRKTKRRVPTRERQPLEVPPVPNAVWSVDFVHDTLYCGRRFRTLNVMDEGVRECLGIEIDTSLPGARLVRTLEQIKESQGVPKAIRCDNGPELISRQFVAWCEENDVEIRYIQPGKPNQNAYIERFNRTYREEVLSSYLFDDLDEVREITWEWLLIYNEERPHDALGGLPPAAFREKVEAENSTLEMSC
jgi:putative transposase